MKKSQEVNINFFRNFSAPNRLSELLASSLEKVSVLIYALSPLWDKFKSIAVKMFYVDMPT